MRKNPVSSPPWGRVVSVSTASPCVLFSCCTTVGEFALAMALLRDREPLMVGRTTLQGDHGPFTNLSEVRFIGDPARRIFYVRGAGDLWPFEASTPEEALAAFVECAESKGIPAGPWFSAYEWFDAKEVQA